MAAKIKFCGSMRTKHVGVTAEGSLAYLGAIFASGPRAVTFGHAGALDRVRPDMVEGSLGVDACPVSRTPTGIEDPQQIARFVEAVLAPSPLS